MKALEKLLCGVWIFMHDWKKSEKLQSFEQFMGYLRPFTLRPCVVVTQKCILQKNPENKNDFLFLSASSGEP